MGHFEALDIAQWGEDQLLPTLCHLVSGKGRIIMKDEFMGILLIHWGSIESLFALLHGTVGESSSSPVACGESLLTHSSPAT